MTPGPAPVLVACAHGTRNPTGRRLIAQLALAARSLRPAQPMMRCSTVRKTARSTGNENLRSRSASASTEGTPSWSHSRPKTKAGPRLAVESTSVLPERWSASTAA